MKKNITINLCGRLFPIDEDAYEMLATYEQSLRNYFRTREGGEEIADDIEERIAELFEELKQGGTEAVTIEHVTEVIRRLGKPEEMEGNDQPTPDPSTREGSSNGQRTSGNESPSLGEGIGVGRSSKRLYRNPADKKVMGVLSGFAAYFGGDVLWWRLCYAAIILLSFFGSSFNFLWFLHEHQLYFHLYYWGWALIIAYILLAILMPIAITPEDRLRMKGKEVNPQNLAEEVASQTPDPSAQVKEPKASGCLGCIGGFFTTLWAVVVLLFRSCIYVAGVLITALCLAGMAEIISTEFFDTSLFPNNDSFLNSAEGIALTTEHLLAGQCFDLALFIVLGITAYAIIRGLLNESKLIPAMPYGQRVVLLVTWIIGFVITGSLLAYLGPKYTKAERQYNLRIREENEALDREANTHDGIYIQPHEWEFLQDNGWSILRDVRCNHRFTTTGQYMNGDREVRYLDNYGRRQRYRAERVDTLLPGTYRLTCAARANGTGAFIYAIVGDGQPIFKEIPATGNTGGDIWEKANEFVHYHRDVTIPTDSISYGNYQCELAEANRHRGYGWNRITFDPIRITKPTVLRYGLTSDNTFTHRNWLGRWFSATDFEVSNIHDSK